jgi:hypothetical protein
MDPAAHPAHLRFATEKRPESEMQAPLWPRPAGGLAASLRMVLHAPSAASHIIALAASLGAAALLLAYFYNRFWWPVDEGVYAYVAQRILAGDVLHRDIMDLHAGSVNFFHALVFRMFGEDLVALRYPLVVATLLQSLMAGLLVRDRGPLIGATAVFAVAGLSFIQFLNPSGNWYALFLALLTCWCLRVVDWKRGRGAILIGACLGTCFLFRQLSGVFLAMGVLTFMLVNTDPSGVRSRAVLSRTLFAIMLCGLAGYLWVKGSPTAFVLFGAGPAALLALAMIRTRADDRQVLSLTLKLALGFVAATTPLLAYHASQGSVVPWLNDTLFTALRVDALPFIGNASFLPLILEAGAGLWRVDQPGIVLNAVFWLGLMLAAPLLGFLVVAQFVDDAKVFEDRPLPIVALFFALGASFFQIPLHIFFVIPPVLVALLWFVSARYPLRSSAVLTAVVVIGIVFQAGQPVSRGWLGVVHGTRVPLDAENGLPRAALAMERSDQTAFTEILTEIAVHARPDEPVFTIPMEPEINFLSARRSPVHYYNTAMGLQSDDDVHQSLARLLDAAPLFVVHRRQDKYLTPRSAVLLDEIRKRSPPAKTIGPFDLYRMPAEAP